MIIHLFDVAKNTESWTIITCKIKNNTKKLVNNIGKLLSFYLKMF